jgi:hypothetical protein
MSLLRPPDDRKDDRKLEPAEIDTEGTAVSWLSNFWYYHKWKLLLVVFLTVVVTVCTLQMCGRDDADVTMLYAGSCYLQSRKYPDMQKAFAALLPGDSNGDGKKSVDIASCNIYSEEQIEDRKRRNAEDSNVILVNTYVNQRELNSFDNLIIAGEYSIVICEPWLYSRVAKSGGFRRLADVLGSSPEGAVDEYAIRFRDLPFARDHAELFSEFTEDTVIALRTESQIGSLLGKKRAAKLYDSSVELFKAIVAYEGTASEEAGR